MGDEDLPTRRTTFPPSYDAPAGINTVCNGVLTRRSKHEANLEHTVLTFVGAAVSGNVSRSGVGVAVVRSLQKGLTAGWTRTARGCRLVGGCLLLVVWQREDGR